MNTPPGHDMACRQCLTPLNILNGTYCHPSHLPDPGHQPQPTPVSAMEIVNRRCDFCGDPFPLWQLDTGDLTVIAGTADTQLLQNLGSSWAACHPCWTDIDTTSPAQLTHKAIRGLGITADPHTVAHLSALHHTLIEHRRPGRTLITTTPWPPAAIGAADLPKIRTRLAAFLAGTDRLPAPMDAHRQQIQASLARAHLYWIDPAFTELAQHAATSLPPDAITAELAPCDDGLLAWPHPVTARHITAISWTRQPSGHTVTVYRTIGNGLPDPHIQHLRQQIGWLAPAATHHLTQSSTAVHPAVAVAAATWLLITQQAAETVEAPPAKAARNTARRTGKPAPPVRIVRIKPATPAGTIHTGDAGKRLYRNRFWVTGHWRNQPYGPGRTQRRLVYISPFLRGPHDAPITATTTVRALTTRPPAATANPGKDENP
ncbi:hypothetical protein [Catelliglobosispora koreensis]|uniref:hypothetical protein n=1 Tax=Catelliglobosispora koreensis TaxID=129052 RepID=UPI0003AAFC01|nr:hypothetical protein [Catelliglobosispora koreensis]